ncbi:uncharacterized protein LOC142620616 [Castanea sativa]|uniref:uncharacterized protein LOC142620616 n=1 Tax=Castanea sativa TaxID=21020 RepID=UPI003F64A453
MGTVSSTLHLKVKYPTHGRVGELLVSQAMARQCLMSAITRPPKNSEVEAGSTYQRMVTRMFESQIGRNMEAYIDDMVIIEDHLANLEEIFSVLKEHKLRLNASKCSFELPLQALLRKSEYIGRVAKWGTRLRAYDVKYMPRPSIKGQILADFVVEFTEGNIKKDEEIMGVMVTSSIIIPLWKVYIDGASNRKVAGIGIVLITPEKLIVEKSLRLGFLAINNKAKYEALLASITMFDSKAFKRYCGDLGIRNGYSTPAYPHRNGQAEATNKVIVAGLKKRPDDAKGKWVDELHHVLWTYRTNPRRSTGGTPFAMTYGVEAVIPLESGFLTLKYDQFNVEEDNHMLLDSLDTAEERREVAIVIMACYQKKLKQSYDKGVKLRPLAPGELVLRKVVGTTKNPAWGKLGPNWEGPYRITSTAGIRVYYLEDLDENAIPRPWNTTCKDKEQVMNKL